MKYIKVIPQAGLTSEQRAQAISYELFAISRPPQVRSENDVTNYLFGWVKFAEGSDAAYLPVVVDTALEVDESTMIPVHPDNDLTNLIALFPELSQAEKDALANYIQSQQSFPFVNIVPSETKLFKREEMEQSGWFNIDSI